MQENAPGFAIILELLREFVKKTQLIVCGLPFFSFCTHQILNYVFLFSCLQATTLIGVSFPPSEQPQYSMVKKAIKLAALESTHVACIIGRGER